MTVDSEVIFAVAEATGSSARGFEEFRGSMAAAWLDEREPELLYLARGIGRPLWVGTTRRELFFASTERALEIAEQYTGLRLRKRELAEGTLAALKGARAVAVERFTPDPTYEADPLPAVRAPHEGAFCLDGSQALAALAGSPSAPVALDRHALLPRRSPHEVLERRPGAAARVEHPVDLPLGQQRRVVACAPPPSR